MINTRYDARCLSGMRYPAKESILESTPENIARGSAQELCANTELIKY